MWFKVKTKERAKAVADMLIERGIPFDYSAMHAGWEHFSGDHHDQEFCRIAAAAKEASSPGSYQNSLGERV